MANGFDNRSPSGGLYLLDINADTLGQGGVDDVVYDDPDFPGPRGVYTITSTLVSGTNATGQLIVLTDRLSSTPGQFGPRTQTLTTENPTATIQVNLTDSDVNQIQRLSRTQGAKRKR